MLLNKLVKIFSSFVLTLELRRLKIFIITKVLKQRVLRSNLPVGSGTPVLVSTTSNGYVVIIFGLG